MCYFITESGTLHRLLLDTIPTNLSVSVVTQSSLLKENVVSVEYSFYDPIRQLGYFLTAVDDGVSEIDRRYLLEVRTLHDWKS